MVFPGNRIRVGESASAMCTLVAESSDVRFRWLKDSVDVSGTATNLNIKNDKTVSMLTIESVTLQDAGNYTCIVDNTYGSDASTAMLVVEGKRAFLHQLQGR